MKKNVKSQEAYARGERIAAKRKELGKSQDTLADEIGIGRQALSAIENGGDFKAETLDRLVSALGVSSYYVMHGVEDEKEALLEEVKDELASMDVIEIKRWLAMMKASKAV